MLFLKYRGTEFVKTFLFDVLQTEASSESHHIEIRCCLELGQDGTLFATDRQSAIDQPRPSMIQGRAIQPRTAQRKIIETFLSRGISQSLKDGNGNSVLDCATSEWVRTLHAKK